MRGLEITDNSEVASPTAVTELFIGEEGFILGLNAAGEIVGAVHGNTVCTAGVEKIKEALNTFMIMRRVSICVCQPFDF